MPDKTIKQEQRDAEKLEFARDMFWNNSEKQNLIQRLLQKIYDLEDELIDLKANQSNCKYK